VRGGQLFSKMRYASAQLEAMIADGLYLRNATHANRMAKRLSEGLERLPGVELIDPVEANEVFVRIPERAIAAFAEEGIEFYTREVEGRPRNRFVCAWNTPVEAIDDFIAALARHLGDA
jgi:threonine aldolase